MTSINRKPAMMPALAIAALAVALAAGTSQRATAGEPCEPQWVNTLGQPGFGGPGSTHPVHAMTVYNGDLIAGGQFSSSDGVNLFNIARWDDCLGWQPLDFGVQGLVNALVVYNGDLIAGGLMLTASGEEVNHIARWDGEQWHPFTAGGQIGVSGEGTAVSVHSLTIHNDDLIVGGVFTTAGGQTLNNIARWDGSAWHPFNAGGQIGVDHPTATTGVSAMTLWNGDLIAGGTFETAGGQTVNHIARWDGSAWHDFTSGGQIGVSSTVRALTVYLGDVVAGGTFSTAGGQTVNRIARWDGSEWQTFTAGGQTGVTSFPNAFAVDGSDLFVGGNLFVVGGVDPNNVVRWDGDEWHLLESGGQVGVSGPTGGEVFALMMHENDLLVGGEFNMAGGQTANFIAAWGGCPLRGACCVNGIPVQLTSGECLALNGAFHGSGVPSEDAQCDPICPADLTHDGAVGGPDLLQLLSAWGACP